jgi:hypothetical protein
MADSLLEKNMLHTRHSRHTMSDSRSASLIAGPRGKALSEYARTQEGEALLSRWPLTLARRVSPG